MSFLHLVQQQYLASCCLYWYSENLIQHHSLLLGVILDRSLKFNAHLKKLTTSLSSSLWIIRATAHTSWSWRCSTLKMAFHVLIHSKIDYAAPTWQAWLSTTNLSCLDHLQNHSLQLITDQLKSSPLEALCLEATIQSWQTCRNC